MSLQQILKMHVTSEKCSKCAVFSKKLHCRIDVFSEIYFELVYLIALRIIIHQRYIMHLSFRISSFSKNIAHFVTKIKRHTI